MKHLFRWTVLSALLATPGFALAQRWGPAFCEKPALQELVQIPIRSQFDGCFYRFSVPLLAHRRTEAQFLVFCATPENRGVVESTDVKGLLAQLHEASKQTEVGSWDWWIAPIPAEATTVDWTTPDQTGCRFIGPTPEREVPKDERCRRGPGQIGTVLKGRVNGPLPRVIAIDVAKLFPVDGAYVLTSGTGVYKPKTKPAEGISGFTYVACRPRTPDELSLVALARADIALTRDEPDMTLAEIEDAWSRIPEKDLPKFAVLRARAYRAKKNLVEQCRWAQWAYKRAPAGSHQDQGAFGECGLE